MTGSVIYFLLERVLYQEKQVGVNSCKLLTTQTSCPASRRRLVVPLLSPISILFPFLLYCPFSGPAPLSTAFLASVLPFSGCSHSLSSNTAGDECAVHPASSQEALLGRGPGRENRKRAGPGRWEGGGGGGGSCAFPGPTASWVACGTTL